MIILSSINKKMSPPFTASPFFEMKLFLLTCFA